MFKKVLKDIFIVVVLSITIIVFLYFFTEFGRKHPAIIFLGLIIVLAICMLYIFRKRLNKTDNDSDRFNKEQFRNQKYKNLKGENLELKIREKLRTLNIKNEILLNVKVPFNGFFNSQIDALVITERAIFVIEAKNWNCKIILKDGLNKAVYKSGYEKELNKVVKQNQDHIKALSKFLNIDRSVFESIICFGGETKFEEEMNFGNSDWKTTNLNNIMKELMDAYEKSPTVYTENEIIDIVNKLKNRSCGYY